MVYAKFSDAMSANYGNNSLNPVNPVGLAKPSAIEKKIMDYAKPVLRTAVPVVIAVGLYTGCVGGGSDSGIDENGNETSRVSLNIPQESINAFIDGINGRANYTERFTEELGNNNVTVESAEFCIKLVGENDPLVCNDLNSQDLIDQYGSNVIPAGGVLEYDQSFFVLGGRQGDRTNTYTLRDPESQSALILQSVVRLDARDLNNLEAIVNPAN